MLKDEIEKRVTTDRLRPIGSSPEIPGLPTFSRFTFLGPSALMEYFPTGDLRVLLDNVFTLCIKITQSGNTKKSKNNVVNLTGLIE